MEIVERVLSFGNAPSDMNINQASAAELQMNTRAVSSPDGRTTNASRRSVETSTYLRRRTEYTASLGEKLTKSLLQKNDGDRVSVRHQVRAKEEICVCGCVRERDVQTKQSNTRP